MTRLEYAQLFRSLGIATIPLRYRGKEPEGNLLGGTWERYKTQLPADYELKNWFGANVMNYGVVVGWNHLAVIDFDDQASYEIWRDYMTIFLKYKVFDETPYTVKTSRGAHVYVTLYNETKNQKRRGVDVKVNGYVVGPASIHPSGAVYSALATEYRFPEVFDLNTILPEELFPSVTASAAPTPFDADFVFQAKVAAASAGALACDDLITKVKAAVRIEDWFPNRKKSSADGRWYMTRCPFHDDQRPSMWIDAWRQLCGCQVCNMKNMDVINLYARKFGVGVNEAPAAYARELGIIR